MHAVEGNGYSEEWHREAARRGLPNNTSANTLSIVGGKPSAWDKNADPKAAAVAYVKAHPEVMKGWFDGVTTFDGKGPAADAVKKGLGL